MNVRLNLLYYLFINLFTIVLGVHRITARGVWPGLKCRQAGTPGTLAQLDGPTAVLHSSEIISHSLTCRLTELG